MLPHVLAGTFSSGVFVAACHSSATTGLSLPQRHALLGHHTSVNKLSHCSVQPAGRSLTTINLAYAYTKHPKVQKATPWGVAGVAAALPGAGLMRGLTALVASYILTLCQRSVLIPQARAQCNNCVGADRWLDACKFIQKNTLSNHLAMGISKRKRFYLYTHC